MTGKDAIAELRARWDLLTGFRLRESLLHPEIGSPFGRTSEGLLDYRGCPMNESLHLVTVEKADFSLAWMELGQFAGSHLRNCRFVEAALTGSMDQEFIDCDFTAASLRESILRGVFANCSFERANLVAVGSKFARFENCVFDRANLKKSGFYDDHFVRCTFRRCKWGSGSLGGSHFEECVFENPNFRKVVLRGTKGLEQYLDQCDYP